MSTPAPALDALRRLLESCAHGRLPHEPCPACDAREAREG